MCIVFLFQEGLSRGITKRKLRSNSYSIGMDFSSFNGEFLMLFIEVRKYFHSS